MKPFVGCAGQTGAVTHTVVRSSSRSRDEVYVVASQGHPETVQKRPPGAPVEGRTRGGAVVVRMPEHVQQTTLRSLIERFIAPGGRVYTDEYDIDHRLPEWGFDHRTVCRR